MDSDEVLFCCKTLSGATQSDMAKVIRLLIGIHNNRINELEPFFTVMCNLLIQYDEKMDAHLGDDFEESIVRKFNKFVFRMKEKQLRDQDAGILLFKEIRTLISKVCFENGCLRSYIGAAKTLDEKRPLKTGFEFVYGVAKGLNGEKLIGVLLTRMLNYYLQRDGVPLLELTSTEIPAIEGRKDE